MRKILVSALLLAAAAPAFAAEPVRFEHDGTQYEYAVTNRADGSRVITGRNLSNRQPFQFLVCGRTVTGTVGADQVAFDVPRQSAGSVEIASQ